LFHVSGVRIDDHYDLLIFLFFEAIQAPKTVDIIAAIADMPYRLTSKRDSQGQKTIIMLQPVMVSRVVSRIREIFGKVAALFLSIRLKPPAAQLNAMMAGRIVGRVVAAQIIEANPKRRMIPMAPVINAYRKTPVGEAANCFIFSTVSWAPFVYMSIILIS
jgi:hypothetical protein